MLFFPLLYTSLITFRYIVQLGVCMRGGRILLQPHPCSLALCRTEQEPFLHATTQHVPKSTLSTPVCQSLQPHLVMPAGPLGVAAVTPGTSWEGQTVVQRLGEAIVTSPLAARSLEC